MVQLSGLAMSVPITTDDNAKFKLENERNYHLLLKAAFAWIWRLSLRLCTHNKFRQSCLQSKQRGFCPWGQAEPRHTSRWAEPLRMEEVYAISSYFWHLSQFLVISWPNRGSRNSIWSMSSYSAKDRSSQVISVSLRPVCLHDESRADAGVSLKKE